MKAVVLLSGGIDSAVALHMASQIRKVVAVTFDYQQLNRSEIGYAHAQARAVGADWVRVDVDTVALEGYGLVGGSLEHHRSVADISADHKPRSYTPARNTIFLSHALGIAETRGCDEIWVGANLGDQNGYADCRRDYLDAFERTALAGGYAVHVIAPLIGFTKTEVVQRARQHAVDLELTSSCYYGTDCGSCDACVLRKHALESA